MSQFIIRQFDKYFVEKDDHFLHQLSTFYCNIWRFDPNFAEYMQCTNGDCGKYFSYNDYHQKNITCCTICSSPLTDAWKEDDVAQTIINLINMEEDFFGVVAVLPDFTNTILGF